MSEEYRIQASYSTRGGLMVNIRHENAEGFVALMEQVASMGPIFDAVGETVNPPKSLNAEQEAQTISATANELGGTVVGKVCPHGDMILKNGANWSAWMCPAPKNDPSKCQPIDAKTGKAWPKR